MATDAGTANIGMAAEGAALNLEALAHTPRSDTPFTHVHVPGFVRPDALAAIHGDFPAISRGGSFPVGAVRSGPAFAALLDEMRGDAFRDAIAAKFDMDLSDRPTMITVRGQCRATDGKIHTDSDGKLVTVLLYLNEGWIAPNGQLRLLRGGGDLEDYAAEIPPGDGTLLAFKCTPNAWHGHTSYTGPRRAIQLNWVRDGAYLRREQVRHRVSALFKPGPR